MRVFRKGTGAAQWLPASPDAFVWLRLYFTEIDAVPADQPIWWTLRRRRGRDSALLRHQPLNYEALRAVLRRVNAMLGTNWTMHDLRHTCAIRMVRDKRLSLRDVQTILGHAHLTTTQTYLVDEYEVIGRVREYLAEPTAAGATPTAAAGYDSADLAVLFGALR